MLYGIFSIKNTLSFLVEENQTVEKGKVSSGLSQLKMIFVRVVVFTSYLLCFINLYYIWFLSHVGIGFGPELA
jgi:hypothetical protein